MAAEPSVKGAWITRLVEDVKKLLARNEPDRAKLEAQLSSETLALLEGEVEIGRWYPVAQYTELTELLWREEGDRSIVYLHQRGEDAMRRLMEAGLYQQLDYLKRHAPGNRDNLPQEDLPRTTQRLREDILRVVRLVGTVSGSMRNIGRDSIEWDPDHPDRLLWHHREAADMPEVARLVGEGLVTFLLRYVWLDAPQVTSHRVTPDHIVYIADYRGFFEELDGATGPISAGDSS